MYRNFVCFFNDTATTEIYTLSLHDALPISPSAQSGLKRHVLRLVVRPSLSPSGRPTPPEHPAARDRSLGRHREDRKSTRLNSSHANISYAVFCLKKKKTLAMISNSTTYELL